MRRIKAAELKAGDVILVRGLRLPNGRPTASVWHRIASVELTQVPVTIEHVGVRQVPGVCVTVVDGWWTLYPNGEGVAVKEEG